VGLHASLDDAGRSFPLIRQRARHLWVAILSVAHACIFSAPSVAEACSCRCPPACSTPVMIPAIGPVGGLAMSSKVSLSDPRECSSCGSFHVLVDLLFRCAWAGVVLAKPARKRALPG